MDLAMLNSGTPNTKPWLNPVVNSIESDKVYQVSLVQTITTTPATITPPNWVNAVIYCTGGADRTINSPSADDFKAYFGKTPENGFSFTTYFYRGGGNNATINLGAGVTEFGLGGSSISNSNASGIRNLNLRYVCEGGAWTVFY